jgi:hypothetical protein
MTSTTLLIGENKASAAEISLSLTESEPLPLTEGPEISRAGWKVIISLLVGSVLFLAVLGGYVIAGMYRFQNCL